MSTAATRRTDKPVGKTLPRLWPPLHLSEKKIDEVVGFLMAAAAIFAFAALVSHHPLDRSWLHHDASPSAATGNLIGRFGAQFSAVLFAAVGVVSLALPVLLALGAWRRLAAGSRASEEKGRALGVGLFVGALPPLAQLVLGEIGWRGEPLDAGGTLGLLVADALTAWLNTGGAFLLLATLLVVGLSLGARDTFAELVAVWRQQAAGLWGRWVLARAQRSKRENDRSKRRRVIRQAREQAEERERRDTATARLADRRGSAPRVRPPSQRPSHQAQQAGASGGLLDLPLRVTERVGERPATVRKVAAADRPSADRLAADRVAADRAALQRLGAERLAREQVPDGGEPAEEGASPLARAAGTARPPAAPTDEEPSADRPVRAAAHPAATALFSRRPSVPQVAAPKPPAAAAPGVTALPPVVDDPLPGAIDAVPQQAALDVAIEPAELPPVNLLSTERPQLHHDEGELVRRSETIRESAAHFGVDGEMAGISPGPVITVFEFRPAPGVKVSKVVNLQDDLALALRADSVRIDRIPGRSTLGLEVPNEKRSIIHLGQLLDDERFRKAPSPLTMALGVDLHGKPVFYDLATMPHLLVAGATGAGKSVGLQAMITSILYKATKHDVKFIFIDPKRVELGVYSEIPHLKTEVVVEPKKAANALRWAVAEMERRYRLLAEVHVRSIDIYNQAIRDPQARKRLLLEERDGEISNDDLQPLPYYVIIIDELADLMMVSSSEVEASIARLAQMARAVGIHLIIATQRPSVDVLTGTIKANFPCRLAFATATRHDSRTILDQVGAEKLLGKGDALFMPPGTSRIRRLHGAYISEQETAALVRWLKRRGAPDLDPDVVAPPEEEASTGSGNAGAAEDDPLFDDAARLVVRERQASASFLQRRMRVGFSRAARLVDLLEADGLLGPAQGSKPREVLVPVDYFDEVDERETFE
ncbi:MAG: DNA translocase FtsK [Acidobacteriota bacterium]